jgi:hypothetical protein
VSQRQEVGRSLRQADDVSLLEEHRNRGTYVLLFAVACTMAWIGFWLWVVLQVVGALVT